MANITVCVKYQLDTHIHMCIHTCTRGFVLSAYSINWLGLTTETASVYCAVQAESQSTGWLKKMDSILYVYISWTIHGMRMIYITFKRESPIRIPQLELSPSAQPCSSVSWEQNGYYAVQDFCLYQRRTWEEFKRVLIVAHASQPVERAENLEYHNQLSGVCWGAV